MTTRAFAVLLILGMALAFVAGLQLAPATAGVTRKPAIICMHCPSPTPTPLKASIAQLQLAVTLLNAEVAQLSRSYSYEGQQMNALQAQINTLSAKVSATPTPRPANGLLPALINWHDLKTYGMSTGNYDGYLVQMYHN